MNDMPGLAQVERFICHVSEARVVVWPECSCGPEG